MTDLPQNSQTGHASVWRMVRRSPFTGIFAVVALALAAVYPHDAWAALRFSAWNLLLVAPMIAIGIVLTAGVTATGSMALIAASFRGREFRMIALTSLIGALTPVCGVTVLPLVAGLLAARVPLAPIMAFWLSSPITDPGMLTITWAMLGPEFAVAKTLGALGAGLLGGTATLLLTRSGRLADPERNGAVDALAAPGCGTCGPDGIRWAFWKDAGRRKVFADAAFATGRLMLIWLTLAFIAEYFLRDWLPADVIGQYVGGQSRFAVPLAALIGAPVYLDGYAALPFIRALIDNGMDAGAAMAFLIAGGIISAWAAIPVFALVRLPVFVLYVVLAVASAMVVGWGYQVVVS